MSSNDDGKEFEENENNERVVAIDEDVDDNNYIEYDPEMENADDEVEDDDKEEGEDEEGEDDHMVTFTTDHLGFWDDG